MDDSPQTPDVPNSSASAYDLYADYGYMREMGAVRWGTDWDSWVVCGHAEAASVLKDRRFSADRFSVPKDRPEIMWSDMERVNALLSRQMVFMDPPGHTRLRGLVTRAFTPRVIDGLRPRIEEVANTLLDRAEPAGRIEIIGEFAHLLPVTVIAEMLGVPAADHERFRKWADDFFAILDGQCEPAQQQAVLASVLELTTYFERLIEERKEAPTDDLLSALTAARDEGDKLTDAELIANCLLLLSAGHETTTNLIGNGLLTLLRHPEECARLSQSSALLPTAIEEMLRYESPVQWTGRRALENVELGGQRVKAGDHVALCLGAANRDPLAFPDPERFDVARENNRHLAFGYGTHFCLGAALARLEGQIALGTLLQRFPDLRLASPEVDWRTLASFRALKALLVLLSE